MSSETHWQRPPPTLFALAVQVPCEKYPTPEKHNKENLAGSLFSLLLLSYSWISVETKHHTQINLVSWWSTWIPR